MAAILNYSNIMWIKQLLKGMNEEIIDLVVIYCDNTSAINISKNIVMHTQKKHIAINYHYLRELAKEKEVKWEYVHTKEQISNIFTKALSKVLKLMKNQPHNSQESHAYKHLAQKREGKSYGGWNCQIHKWDILDEKKINFYNKKWI